MSNSTTDAFFVGATVILILGIIVAYGAFITPPTNAEINELEVSVNNDTPVSFESNQTTVYITDGDNITVTDGNGTDLTRYVRFASQSENSNITISGQGEVNVDEDACEVEYRVVHHPYSQEIPVPTNFTQETFTVTFDGQTTEITISCELFARA